MGFGKVNFCGLFACTPSLQTIAEKTFADRHKTERNSRKFSPSKVSRYTVYEYLDSSLQCGGP